MCHNNITDCYSVYLCVYLPKRMTPHVTPHAACLAGRRRLTASPATAMAFEVFDMHAQPWWAEQICLPLLADMKAACGLMALEKVESPDLMALPPGPPAASWFDHCTPRPHTR